MWYESPMIATVVGAVLGFSLAFVPATIQRLRERAVLKTLLNEEVARIVDYSRHRYQSYSQYRDLVAAGGALGVYYADRDMDAVFASNRGALTRLDRDYARKLASFYAHVADFKARAAALSASLRAHHRGEDGLTDQSFFVSAIESLNETLAKIIEEGAAILKTHP